MFQLPLEIRVRADRVLLAHYTGLRVVATDLDGHVVGYPITHQRQAKHPQGFQRNRYLLAVTGDLEAVVEIVLLHLILPCECRHNQGYEDHSLKWLHYAKIIEGTEFCQ
jgi:hypothetical protein